MNTNETININKIIELPKTIADKIAAGEVVDRPLSIIKELVENSIDAGSSSIIVEIRNGGKTYIRVTDNGSGIEKADVELAFKRHATSKIKNSSDLDHITTLGFRGEALASIAAVSRTELITKTPHAQTGIQIKLEGGEILEKTDIGCPEGSTIIIEDLFFNTPARMKFMKPDATESTLIIDFISKLSLAFSEIKIRLINNGNILFSTPGKGDIYANILTVYSKEIGDRLIHLKEKEADLSIEAFISEPSYSKTNRKSQIFFVNGRYISSKLIENAVKEGYKEKLFDGRYPVAYIFLQIAPQRLDVNIHPNKKEIRFDDERLVQDFIVKAIRKNLNTKDAIAEIKQENIFKINKTPISEDINTVINNSDNNKEKQVDIKNVMSNLRNEEKQATEVSKAPVVIEDKSIYDSSSKDIENVFMDLKVLDTIFGTYITGVHEDVFYLIDQHAAHERIFYEQFLDSYENEEKMKQSILVPYVVNVSYAIKNDVDDWLDYLGNIGYEIEEFGPKSFIVKSIPLFMDLEESKTFLEYLMENVSQSYDLKDVKKLDKVISMACKKAVKARDHLDIKEIQQLIKDLGRAKNPYTCPHGRPTLIKLSKYEIEKMFKRV